MSRVGPLAILAILVLAACSGAQPPGGGTSAVAPASSTSPNPTGPASPGLRSVTIGVDLPSGDATRSLVRAVQMAIDDANASSSVSGWQIQALVKDDVLAATGFADPQVGAANVRAFVDDPSVVAMIGPFNSYVASAEIPLTNAAGLLECGLATNPTLTKPPAALQYRSAFPDRINFVRVAASDDDQGPAAAQYAIAVLHKKRAFVIDDTQSFGQGVAGGFATEFAREGGNVVGHLGLANPTIQAADPIVTSAKAKNPDVLYFGGAVVSGTAVVRQEMVKVGMEAVPFLGPDGAVDPEFIKVAGRAAANSFGTINVIGDYPGKADFTARYRAAFGEDPGPYANGAYACTQVVVDSLEHAAGPDPAALREQIRVYAVDPSHRLPTILGDVSFDANGDTTLRMISIYRVDLGANGGKGDWVYDQQVVLTAK